MHPTTAHVLKTYDYLAAARGRVFDRARTLTPRQHAQAFPIGPGSLLRTFAHVLGAEWYYVQRLTEAELPPRGRWPIDDENPPALPVVEAIWFEQAARTRAAFQGVTDWQAEVRYEVDAEDAGRGRRRVTATVSDIFTQLVLHEVHHRAQAMNMLRHLGAPVDDLDFNAMCYRFEDL